MSALVEVHSIEPVASAEDRQVALELWAAYEANYRHLFSYAQLAAAQTWVDALPGRFDEFLSAGGVIWLARDEDNDVLGTIAMQRLDDGIARMTRLYIPHEFRKEGLGKALLAHAIHEARLAQCTLAYATGLKQDLAVDALMATVGFVTDGDCTDPSIPDAAWPLCRSYALNL